MPRETIMRHALLGLLHWSWRNERPDPYPALPTDTFWGRQWWNEPVDTAPIDLDATGHFHSDEIQLVRGANSIIGHSWGGVPLQLVDSRGQTTVVHHRHSNARWHLPLPRPYVRRFGDPIDHFHGSDSQWFGVDVDAGVYYEVGALGFNYWLQRWECGGVYIHDLKSTPPPPSQAQRAITAANIPMHPLVASVDDLFADRNRRVQHLCFAAIVGDQTREGSRAGWSTDWVPPATDTDGQSASHWAKAGMRLRIRSDYRAPANATPLDLIRIDWGKSHGFILSDQTSRTAGHLIRSPQDRRADFRVNFRTTDFEFITP